MEKEILISGFGGQGLMSLGKIIARAALKSNKHTIWFPSYGAEMRGGTAHCFVKISDKPIASPFIVYPDIAIILNQPSLDKFRKVIKKGILVTNKDLIGKISMSKNITLKNLPLNSMALESGNIRVVNTIALGIVFPFIKPLVSEESIITTLKESFKGKGILKVNLQAFGKGLSLAG